VSDEPIADVPEVVPAQIGMPVLPLRDVVVYPHMVIPLFVGREKSIVALDLAMKADKRILLVAQKQADVDDPKGEDLYRVGTVATILQLLKLPDGTVKVLVEGVDRASIEKLTEGEFFSAEVTALPDQERYEEREMDVLTRSVITQFEQYVKLNKKVPPEILTSLAGIEQAGRLADTVAAHMSLKLSEKQKVLEIPDVRKRLEHMLAVIEGEMDVLQIEKRIRGRVKQQMEKSQREYYLNEQMKAIQKELGELDDAPNEIGELEKRIKHAQGGAREGQFRAREVEAHVAHVGGSHGGAQLHRLVGEVTLEEAQQGAFGYCGCREGARSRSLWLGEGQRAHCRVPRGAAAGEEPARPDPVSGGTAGCGQNLAGPKRGAFHQPQIRAHVLGRRAR
jgi:ATP-dependent Lon protease